MFKNKLKIFPSHQQHFDSNLHIFYSKCEDNKLMMTFSYLIWHVDLCSGLETSVIGCRCECWSAGGLVCTVCDVSLMTFFSVHRRCGTPSGRRS